MNRISKIFVWSLAVVAVLGFAGKVSTANAAAQPGSLIKMNGLSSVYYLGADSKRYVFPDSRVYFSWYKDFSGVVTISQSELESYPLAANVTMRPGTRLVKITTNPKVYAVEPGGNLRAIASEAAARELYGTNWKKRVADVADAFFTNYKMGSALANGQVPAGSLVKNAGSAAVYYFDGTNYRNIASETAFNANRFSFDNVLTISNTITAGGTAITANEFANPDSSATGVGTIPGQGTGLTVALSASTPASQDVPRSVATTIMKFNVTASNDGDVNINGVKLTAIGLGNANDIDGISIFNKNVRLNSSARDIDSNKEAQINFSQPFVVKKGTTETFEVRAKIGGTAKYGLSINKTADIATTATVSGTFPVNGNIMSGVDVTVGTLTIAKDGTSLSDVKLGDKQGIFAKFKLSNSGDTEDITLNAVSFKKDTNSTASDDDVENLSLYLDGTLVATTPSITNRFVTFTLTSPMTINKNTENRRLVIKADAVDGAAKTLGFKIDSESDVVATGNHYGYQVVVSGDAISGNANLATIKAGEVTIEKVNAANDKLLVDTDNQEAGTLKIRVNSGKNVELSKFVLTLNTNDNSGSTTAPAYIENIELYNKTNNTTYDLSYVATSSTSSLKQFKNESMGLVLNSGVTNELVVRFDTKTSSAGKYYTASINNAITDLTLKELGNDTLINDITPNTVELKKVTVLGSSAEFSNNALANIDVVTGSTDVVTNDFNIKAGENSNVYVKELTVAKDSAGNLATISNQNISDFKLWKSGSNTPVKTMSSSQISGNAITFTDLNEQVNANQSVRYYVTASFVKNSDSNDKNIKFKVSAATVEDSEGKTVSGTTGLPLTSGRLITLKGTGTLTNIMDNDNTATKDNTYQIAGSQDVAVASVKMKATNEAVKITKMSVIADGTTGTNLVNNINEIGIYDGSTRIAYTNNIGVTSTMSGLSFVVPTSEKTYTIKVKLNEYGLNKTAVLGTDVRFALVVDEAQGDMSGDTVSAPAQTDWSKYMALTPAKVAAVSMVSSYNGINIASHLSSGQTQNAAIIKVTAPTFGNNTDSTGGEMKTLINALQLNLVGDYDASTSSVSVERIGGSGNATTTTTISGGYAILDLSGMADSDKAITSGQDAYFLVKVKTATWDGSTNSGTKSLTVNLNKLNGASGAGNYNFKWMEKDGSAKYDLRIPGVTKVDGIQINN